MTGQLVNTQTGEIVEVTYGEVRESVALARESGTKFFEQIVWQIERQAWTVLGHASWDAMRETEYGEMGVVVPRADRPEVVARMRKSGLTQRQIAETVGVNEATVSRDLANASSDLSVDPIINSRGQQRPASYSPPQPAARAPEPFAAEPASALGEADGQDPPVDLNDFIDTDSTVALTSWRKNFMGAIAKSGAVMVYDPQSVAEKAGADLIDELERLAAELNDYVSRVHARRPTQRLTAIRGGAQ